MRQVRILSPAKINLFLEVLGKRPDGYHEIRTLMQVVDLWDEIFLKERESGIELQVTGLAATVPRGEDNLVHRAARLLLREMGTPVGIAISLHKRIPTAGGLGGGSSNAAATLWGMKRLFELPFSKGQLRDLALSLGSDVPFFLSSGSALAEGRGEILQEVELPCRWAIIVYPGFGVSSKWAYQRKKFELTIESKKDKHIGFDKDCPREERYPFFVNELEEVVVERYPLIRDLKEVLLHAGARVALMSGSGSSVFGIFDDRAQAAEAARHWRGQDCLVHEGRTLDFNPIFREEESAQHIRPFS